MNIKDKMINKVKHYPKDYVSTEYLESLLSVKKRTVDKKRKQKDFTAKKINGSWRYDKESVVRYLEENTILISKRNVK